MAKEYQSDVYDFRVEGSAFDKRMKEQGIVAPDGQEPQSIVYKFYFQAIRNIIKLVIINLVLNAAPIYILAIINQNVNMAGVVFSKGFFTLIFTPYPFVKTSKLYFLFDLVINPLIVVVMTGLFIRELLVYNREITEALEHKEESYMFKCVRLTHLKVSTNEELR